jgi:hypothetical protein
MNCARERCRRWAFVFAKSLWGAASVRGRGAGVLSCGCPARVMLCVDVLEFHIGLEPSLELAHQRQ